MPHIERHLPVRPLTGGPKHHFFGYYDKFPWDETGQYLLAMETQFIDRPPKPDDAVVIGVIDLQRDGEFEPVAETYAWNWQQGTHLQWLPTAADRCIVYNIREGDHYGCVVHDIHTDERRTLPMPIYCLSRDGTQALSVNFSRIHRCRPGYGYNGVPDPWADDPAPEQDGIWWMDMETGETEFIISLADIAGIEPVDSMEGAQHWFNHLQFSTEDSRFIFLHRWRRLDNDGFRATRMFTANPDGSDVYLLNPDDMTSHFDWKSDDQLLAWARQFDIGDRYFLFDDQSDRVEIVGDDVFNCDGHCSYSPDRRFILTDTYPQEPGHKRTLIVYNIETNERIDIGRFYAPPELDGEIRCDLHPRWNRDGTLVCFDSAHEGERQMYEIDVSEITAR